MKSKLRFLFAIALFIFFGCSVSENINKTETNNKDKENIVIQGLDSYKKDLAKAHFIQAATYEQNYLFEKAALEYQEALMYDDAAGIHYALGKVYIKLKKYALASSHLKKAIEKDPSNLEYKNLLAQLYSFTYQEKEAIKIYNEIISKDSSYIDAYLDLAQLYVKIDPKQAPEVLEKLLEKNGEDINIYLLLAEAYNRILDFEKASEVLEKILFLAPGNLELKKTLVNSYLLSSKPEKAESLMVDILSDNPDDYEVRETLAHYYFSNNQWEKAEKEYQKLLNVDTIDVDTRFRIANSFFDKSFEDTSYIRITEKLLLKIDSTFYNDFTNLLLAAFYLREKDTTKFETYFTRIKYFDDRLIQLWFTLSGKFFDKKRYNDAIYMALRGYKNYDDLYQFNYLLGIAYQQLDNYKESYNYLLKAYKLNQKDIYCLSSLGYTLGKLKKYDEAIFYLQKANEIDSKNLMVLSTLATLYDNYGKFEQCDSVYAVAFKLFPDEPILLNNYAYSLAERNIKLDEALEYSKKAIEKDSTNDSYLDTIGWIYYRMGDLSNAEKYVRKAVDLGTPSAEILEHMGDIYYKLGDSELAMVYWKKALEKDPERKTAEQRVKEGKI